MCSKDKTYVIVVCGLDQHIPTIQQCVTSLARVVGDDTNISFGTFASKEVPPQFQLSQWAKERNYEHYDAPRQNFIPAVAEFHCCEILGMLSVARHFAETYEVVYLVHNDIICRKDFLPYFQKHMDGKWSFMATPRRLGLANISYQDAISYGGWKLRYTKARYSQIVVAWNSDFVKELYDRYKDDVSIWEQILRPMPLHGDLALFDFANSILGYHGVPVMEQIFDNDDPAHSCVNHSGLARLINDCSDGRGKTSIKNRKSEIPRGIMADIRRSRDESSDATRSPRFTSLCT